MKGYDKNREIENILVLGRVTDAEGINVQFWLMQLQPYIFLQLP